MAGLRIVVVGSGFAGSILARVLQLQGHQVTLLDRGRHPRFALGESSTPLAALSLERLAARYGLPDLHQLAAYGRWLRHLPQLRRGLKRGFTFYAHRPAETFVNSATNDRRLLVAASRADEEADAHWLREDVDHHLARQAAAAGVTLLEQAELTAVERRGGRWRLSGRHQGKPLRLAADLLVDASGAAGFLARQLPIPGAATGCAPSSSLVFGHFAAVQPFRRAVTAAAHLAAGPYPDEQAAVHHLLAEGWMYVLPFDHGTVSAGVVVTAAAERQRLAQLPPEGAWEELLGRYPTLAAQFAAARPVRPVGAIHHLQHRLQRSAGAGWVLLPHAFCFYSPMFSTGIAWSLLAVERLALLLESARAGARGREALDRGLERYDRMLQREADHLEQLVGGAYQAAARHFDLFAAWTDLYFVAASFAEIRQRLCPGGSAAWAWTGFLGSGDPLLASALARTLADFRRLPGGPLASAPRQRFAAAVRRRIAQRNVAGLADPARNRLYPVDLRPLLRHPRRVGLTGEELRRRLPGLRGGTAAKPSFTRPSRPP